MPSAAKVIGAVRVGLVDIKDLTEELETDEMQQAPEIHMLLYESLLYYVKPSNSSNFAKEKAKLRSTGPVSIYAFTFVSQRVSPSGESLSLSFFIRFDLPLIPTLL